MLRQWNILVACKEMDNRNALIHMLDGMTANVLSCSTLSQVREILSSQKIELIFCDERLSDGSFSELLRPRPNWVSKPLIVVIYHSGEWKECKEAVQLGAFEALSSPLHPTDVELAVIRAMHGGTGQFVSQSAF